MKSFPEKFEHPAGFTAVIEPTRVVIAFKDIARLATKRALMTTNRKLAHLGLVREDGAQMNKAHLPNLIQPVNDTRSRLWVRTRNEEKIDVTAFRGIPTKFADEIAWVGAVYRPTHSHLPNDMFCPLPHVLLIKQLAGLSEKQVKSLEESLKKSGLSENRAKSRYLGPYRYFEIKNPKVKTSFDLKPLIENELRSLIAEVRFENMPLLRPFAFIPNDTLYPQQWNMDSIGASDAWAITVGNPMVVVAIFDSGCDLDHPDLQFYSRGVNLGNMTDDGSPTNSSAHGTCCAGIAAATINNNKGVAGVAGYCLILPIAQENWTEVEIASGVYYAADNGAHVISMSFTADAVDSALIDPAIEYAHNEKGCVLCAATGNQNDDRIRYPAIHPLVIACGASSTDDGRKSPDSPDGEDWGSNYSEELSVVAPGVQVITSDISGTSGYNTGAYYSDFNGTSAATPHVAGLAALVLSINPFLSNVDVRNIIERTADKTGNIPYNLQPGYPNGTRNLEMGYGRISALKAVKLAGQGFAALYNILFSTR